MTKRSHLGRWAAKMLLIGTCINPALAQTSDHLNLQQYWYDVPSKMRTIVNKPVDFTTSSCIANPNLSRWQDARQFVTQRFTRYPLGLSHELFRDNTQFWQYQGHYYQLSAVWDHDVPASYRLEFYRSTDSTFSQAIEQLTIKGVDMANADAVSVEQAFRQVLSEYRSKGATLGANIKVALVQDSNNDPYEVTLLNQTPVIMAGGNLYCSVSSDLNHLQCQCDNQNSHAH